MLKKLYNFDIYDVLFCSTSKLSNNMIALVNWKIAFINKGVSAFDVNSTGKSWKYFPKRLFALEIVVKILNGTTWNAILTSKIPTFVLLDYPNVFCSRQNS